MNLNDITAAQMRAKLHRTYCTELIIHELNSWRMRISRDDTALKRYANSTTNRAMVSRLLCIAAFKNEKDPAYYGTTKQECADKLSISLNSATKIINHFIEEGWAVAHESSCRHIRASEVTMASNDDYGQMIYNLTTTELVLAHQKLLDFDEIATTHLDFTDDSKSE